jgi:hypothetical protein
VIQASGFCVFCKGTTVPFQVSMVIRLHTHFLLVFRHRQIWTMVNGCVTNGGAFLDTRLDFIAQSYS